MEYDDMKAMAGTHVCTMCGDGLVLIWDEENNRNRLCCARDHSHNGYQRSLTSQKSLQRGKADQSIGSGAQKDLEERAKRSETALSLLPSTDIATRQALGITKIGELVIWARNIGLNAHLGHVCLYFGKPYVTIDGYYYKLDKEKEGMCIGTRPMSKEEREAYQIDPKDYAWIAEGWQDWNKLQTVGVGIVTKTETEAKSKKNPDEFRAPIAHDHPQRMAEKRAEWQLLRKLIPLEVKE